MIDLKVRVHDRFSVEFKTGYVVKKGVNVNDFMVNTWFFIPYSLDINPATYNKNHFYRDVKSYIRLITPVYELKDVADCTALPYQFLEVAFNELVAEPSKENMAEYEYQIKMFISIAKSALRQEAEKIMKENDSDKRAEAVKRYLEYADAITSLYRNLKPILEKPGVPAKAMIYFSFGDEFFSNRLEHKTFDILETLKKTYPNDYLLLKNELLDLINKEIAYRRSQGYAVIEKDSPDKNRNLLFRLRLLKKYIENHLFLNADKKKDGRLVEQIYLSIAAGISMIFATVIAFSFQQKYGNFTMPLFVALVVSYMLKDRIKELVRFYFAHRLTKKYFDHKTTISIKENAIGWIKEGSDFISDTKVPEEIMLRRDRSDILESDNRNTEEKIILYRKLVHIEEDALDDNNQYEVSGINDIVRFNISNFILKMDEPEVPVAIPTADHNYDFFFTEHVYYINLLIQLQYDRTTDYKRIRLVVSRNGIREIEQFD